MRLKNFAFVAVLFSLISVAVQAAPPVYVMKNQFGEQSDMTLLFPVQALTAAGAISTTKQITTVANASGSTYAITLAAPSSQDGQLKVIKAVATMSHTVTLAMTNIVITGGFTGTGTTTLTFTNAGDSAVFLAVGAKWVYLGGSAVAS